MGIDNKILIVGLTAIATLIGSFVGSAVKSMYARSYYADVVYSSETSVNNESTNISE